ncbi:hypothetical protein Bca101_056048 [Brassica carinata]
MATTTYDLWNILATSFGKPTRGHILQLKHQIRTSVKGTSSITEYLRSIKTKASDLALLGKPLDPEDLTEQILAGLGEEYKPEIDAVNGRDTPIAFHELHERLLNREAMILCKESPAATPTPITANVTQTKTQQTNWRPNQNNNTRSYNNYNNNRQAKPYLGRCQACGIQGHTVKYCPEFRIVRGSQAQHSQHLPYGNAYPQNSQQQQWKPRANVAMMTGDTSTWLLDSGASHHMTSNLANLSLHSPYNGGDDNGGDDVLLGDGSGLSISHTGSLSLPSLKHPFFLNNVLYIPSLDKNLISVFQLCSTNGVSVTFTPTYFQVRDLTTGALRLQGIPKDGTYQWPSRSDTKPPSLSYASAIRTTLSDWHSRLGHPALSILQTMVSAYDLPISSKQALQCLFY